MTFTPGKECRAPDGPRWTKWAYRGLVMTDGRGELWRVTHVAVGGRVLYWECGSDGRTARTQCAPGHPDYPSDEKVLEWEREQRRQRETPRLW